MFQCELCSRWHDGQRLRGGHWVSGRSPGGEADGRIETSARGEGPPQGGRISSGGRHVSHRFLDSCFAVTGEEKKKIT